MSSGYFQKGSKSYPASAKLQKAKSNYSFPFFNFLSFTSLLYACTKPLIVSSTTSGYTYIYTKAIDLSISLQTGLDLTIALNHLYFLF